MRKVIFSKWIPAIMESVPDKGYKKPQEGTNKWSDQTHEGLFHQWGSESQEDAAGNFVMDTIAIVELPDGTVEYVVPSKMKFLS